MSNWRIYGWDLATAKQFEDASPMPSKGSGDEVYEWAREKPPPTLMDVSPHTEVPRGMLKLSPRAPEADATISAEQYEKFQRMIREEAERSRIQLAVDRPVTRPANTPNGVSL